MSGIFGGATDWPVAALGFGLDVAIKATILIALAWLAHATLGPRHALARSAIWNACILGLICLPLAGLLFPRLSIRIIPALPSAPHRTIGAAEHFDVLSESPLDAIVAQSPVGEVAGSRAVNDPTESTNSDTRQPSLRLHEVASTAIIGTESTSVGKEASGAFSSLVSWSGLAVGVYAVVVGLLLIRLLGSIVAVTRLRGRSSMVESLAWIEGMKRWSAHLELKRAAALLQSERVSVPAVIACVRPAIILPTSLSDAASPSLIDAVLLHELGHIRRGDFGWNLLRKLAQSLYWPHPLAWVIGRFVAGAREQACDDLCVHGLGGAAAYRASLVAVASGLVRHREPALGMAMARTTHLSRRLAWIDQSRGARTCLLQRPARLSLAAAVVVLASLLGAVEASRSIAVADDETAQQSQAKPEARPAASDMALEKIIAALRAEEEKFRNIEYSLRLTTRKIDPNAPDGPGDTQSQETRRVVLQGDRVRFQGESTKRLFNTDRRRTEFSAYDGERTRSVIADNSANIHLGRFEHPDVYPAHAVSLIHYHLNFPLSVYLSGGDAIHAHPKYARFMRETGSVNEFTRVEARVDGEEQIDGLRCVKILVSRWYYSNDRPARQHLWLASERNYHCVKEQLSFPNSVYGDLPTQEMRAHDLREIAPGTWFPMKIAVIDYDREALREKKLIIGSRTETVVEKINLSPRYEIAFFRDVKVPADLPVFTIGDGKLVGSSLPQPIADEALEKAKLEEVVAKVKEQELRYGELEVKARAIYKHVGSSMHTEGVITEQTNEAHSVLRGGLAYFTEQATYSTAGDLQSKQNGVQAFDGQWTRSVNRFVRDDENEQLWASLRKGGAKKAEGRHDGVPVFRPHTYLLRDDWLYGPLADLLVSPWHDKENGYRLRFRYCGEEEFDGHPCVKLRGEVTTREGQPPHHYIALWLATDRNYIPIKLEQYGGNHGLRPIPGGITRCDDFRQIASGVWYPFRTTQFAFDNWQDMARGRITLNWRRGYEVEAATLSPKVDAALFRNVVVPAGTKVQVSDEDGDYVGQYEQEREGVAEITPARYLSLLSEAKVREEEQQARQRAIDALVGKPAPEFPVGATWHNGKPLTWASLRGKVVVLSFWAEWCGPCRNDFPSLSLLHDARESNRLTVIGVHPPGSELEAIKKVADEFHLDYPTCIDIPPKDEVQAWGDLFGRFAVHALPHAVAVDGQGTIVAAGELQKVVAKAIEFSKQ